MENIECKIEHEDIKEFMRMRPTPKQLEDKYRYAVDKWVGVLNSTPNNKYGERLEKATNDMNKLKEQLMSLGMTTTI